MNLKNKIMKTLERIYDRISNYLFGNVNCDPKRY
jgi:hypothetical protein